MSLVVGGYGFGCVVTGGYGCPQPEVEAVISEVCTLAARIEPRVLLISPMALSAMVMSFISADLEVMSMITLSCDLQSIVSQVVDLVSAMDPPAEVLLSSPVTLSIDIHSLICCC